MFSSLRGLEFQWSLHSDTAEEESLGDANSILRYLLYISLNKRWGVYVAGDRGWGGGYCVPKSVWPGVCESN